MEEQKILFKSLKMRTGEIVLTGIRQVFDDNNQPVCYELFHPYTLELIPQKEDYLSEDLTQTNFTVNYIRWFPTTKDPSFKIPFDAIVAIGNPDDELLKTYIDKFGTLFEGVTFENQNNTGEKND